MKKSQATVLSLETQAQMPLDQLIREGAQRMLRQAIEAEVAAYIDGHAHQVDDHGHRQVVRNGYSRCRTIQTGAGALSVRQPRVQDRREGHRFTSSILPPYLRRSKSIETLLPALYLKGISTGQMQEALSALLGDGARGLSPATITRLKDVWQQEYAVWQQRTLHDKQYVYIWADGVYYNVRLSDERPCILVLTGVDTEGRKEIIAVADGERESRLSWKEVLLDLKKRGLSTAPRLCIGDGALGFWAAVREVWPQSRCQRCWVHKTANVLDKLPKKLQAQAKEYIHRIYHAETREDARQEYKRFVELYQDKHPKAVRSLTGDIDDLLTFYDFPAAHWQSIRSTNVIESTFATIRHRTRQTKGCGTRSATLAMVFRLGLEAQKQWRRFRGYHLLKKVYDGRSYSDGIEEEKKTKAA